MPSLIRLKWLSRLALYAAILLAIIEPLTLAGEPGPTQARFIREWGTKGNAPGQFDFPIGVAVDREGRILVTDFYNARVQRFSPEGKYQASFEVLPNAGGITVNAQGHILLTHFSAMKLKEVPKPDRVTVYSGEGKLLRQWGKTGKGDGEFDYPGGIMVGPNGRVYVADQTNHRVQVFDSQGKFLFKWGEFGTEEGQFGGNITAKSRVGGPQFVAADGEGNIYTTEGSVGRVQKFTAGGKFLLAWGDNSDTPGGFGSGFNGHKGGIRGPVAICFDREGKLWISAVSGRVQRFTTEGKYLGGLDTEDSDSPGPLVAPHGVTVDKRDHLYVVDSYNHRVLTFAIGR